MTSLNIPISVQNLLESDSLEQAISLYQQWIETAPNKQFHHLQLGLLYLLSGKSEKAHATWKMILENVGSGEVENLKFELTTLLEDEAQRQQNAGHYQVAFKIRQSIHEVNPKQTENIFILIQLAIQLSFFSLEFFESLKLFQTLKSNWSYFDQLEQERHLTSLSNILNLVMESSFLDIACLKILEKFSEFYSKDHEKIIDIILRQATSIALQHVRPDIAVKFLDFGIQFSPENIDLLKFAPGLYQQFGQYEKSLPYASKCLEISDSLAEKVISSYTLLRGLLVSGLYWNDKNQASTRHLNLIKELVEANFEDQRTEPISRDETLGLFSALFFQPYLRDDLRNNRMLQNQLSEICSRNVQKYAENNFRKYQAKSQKFNPCNKRKLKIGYLSHCLKQHSVGWLARWLYKYHDRESFIIYSYLIDYDTQRPDVLQNWYIQNSSSFYILPNDGLSIAEQIYKDDIDILIDLDSLTLNSVCEVLSIKPAPIQASWLGWDASGIPSVDYFIADSYVLPDEAESVYAEKIWRMPHTYIAVDGFEVGTPSIRRQDFGISSEAIVFLSIQRGFKQNPWILRLQMRIIKEVPGSHFLIKISEDHEFNKQLFNQLADEENVSRDRLHFFPFVSTEAIHRANLKIADVVLDTYPYNGATTTLETLWLGIPLVTRVGTHFSSRNSYTMMMNAGISEGIAWSDQEYVEWGIRLGSDHLLRQEIQWKLWRSRQSSHLWNARQFTHDMEEAYRKMWEDYLH